MQVTEHPSATALAAAAATGDCAAFAQLYDLYVDRIYRYVYYHVGNRQDAEDVTEQVFTRALEAVRRYRPDTGPFIAWLTRIARNTTIDHLRRRKAAQPLSDSFLDPNPWQDPEWVAEARCTQEQLRRAILGLRDEYREVIVLRFVEELSHAQTAAALGKSEGAVRVLQHRALAALRQALAKEVGKQ